MTDPLSIAASIAGLAGLVLNTVSTTYEYGSSVIKASRSQNSFLKELQGLGHTLQQLHRTVAATDESFFAGPTKLTSLTLSEVTTIRQKQEKIQKDNRNRQVIDWLSAIAGDENRNKHDETLRRRVANTGNGFLESPEFTEATGEDPRLLLCHGIPGAGKTVFSATVIERFYSAPERRKDTILYWYFDIPTGSAPLC
ncbi:uncharacterized protein Z518_10056 [Rhinocladiella mackenziei CBS 650.93]|uniref:Rhinocladiella mackenziei CBS 650.93 unplaced genomic scaffold supercont1.8, whole genome shotgun sequence n=1 Tax=Rhinocladiella mackenziei CBS 650.93 TaxID=1442369 RepID=A0A0D2IWJ0_9EURO|nr:uncharacterized protein Z518_10056 [Rhinocladiella mackenziei CBS 650.93]KIX00990.1 hypothetical protein Z518_10056 [Rhinocladiella mackenziei CBS 650.93]